MPRPKRPKLVQTVPQALRVEVPVITSTAQRQMATISPPSSERLTNGSDDSDGLVRKKKGRQNMNAGEVDDYTMSGALATEVDGSTQLRPPSLKTRVELSRIARNADYMKSQADKRDRSLRTLTGQSNPVVKIPSTVSRGAEPNRRQVSSRPDSSTRQPNDKNSLVSRIESTPQPQTSILGAIAFKKRARQPSLLQLAQTQHDASDGFNKEDFDDFRPDDESTPLVKSLSRIDQPVSSSSSQSLGSRKRKLTSPEIQVPASQPEHSIPPQDSPSFFRRHNSQDQRSEETDQEPEPTLPQLRKTRTPSPQIFSDSLAPPQSSSSSPVKPSPKARRRKKPNAASDAREKSRRQIGSPMPAPSPKSSTTASQAYPTHRSKPPPKPLTTARLQNLLPRRRTSRKPHETYDVPSSSDVELDTTHLGEDEDELAFHTTAKVRRKKPAAHKSKREAGKGSKQGADTSPKGKRVSKTYSRKNERERERQHDNENDGSPDNDSSADAAEQTSGEFVLGVKAQAEMKRLADKFKEVDDYTLDFEDMTGSSSQMKDAR